MVSGDPRYISPCRFAIGVRYGYRKSRIDIYEVLREWNRQPKLISQHPLQEELKVTKSIPKRCYSIAGNGMAEQ